MIEAIAKTKWCPFASSRVIKFMQGRVGDQPVKHEARFIDSEEGQTTPTTACIGSECMAWMPTDNESAPCNQDVPEPESQPAGYCGLARRA